MHPKFGNQFLDFVKHTGEISILAVKSFSFVFRRPFYGRLFINRLFLDGIQSIPVIFIPLIRTTVAYLLFKNVQLLAGYDNILYGKKRQFTFGIGFVN